MSRKNANENGREAIDSIHELVNRETDCKLKPFFIASFTGEERQNDKQNRILILLGKLNPNNSSMWHTIDHLFTKVALAALFIMILTKCAR